MPDRSDVQFPDCGSKRTWRVAFDMASSEQCNGIYAETVAIASRCENTFSRKLPFFD